MQKSIDELEKIACTVRRDVLRMVHGVASGHPGGSLGCTDLLVALYFNFLNHSPEKFSMEGKDEDMFFLSNGHLAPLWYSVLARTGYFPISELATLRKLNTRLQGHPATAEGLPGVRVASGSLGQGLSCAIGAALSKKIDKDSNLVFCLTGDGELQEGQIWEAAMFAAAHKVDNIIAVVDYNGKQIDGNVDDVISLGNLKLKWLSFGWEVIEMDGNNMKEVIEKLEIAKSFTGNQKPVVIIMKTIMGKGVDFMEHTHKWHGVAPNDEQLQIALKQLSNNLNDDY